MKFRSLLFTSVAAILSFASHPDIVRADIFNNLDDQASWIQQQLIKRDNPYGLTSKVKIKADVYRYCGLKANGITRSQVLKQALDVAMKNDDLGFYAYIASVTSAGDLVVCKDF